MSALDSKYHEGEINAQERTGRRALATLLANAISPSLTDEAAGFIASLPFVVLAAVDGRGRPWASLLASKPGLLAAEGGTIRISAGLGRADPLYDSLRPGAAVGLIAIDFERRLRYRINGVVEIHDTESTVVAIQQCYRNCPQYIHARRADFREHSSASDKVRDMATLDEPAQALIGRADTFFIASHSGVGGAGLPNLGADASHRGGNPGVVRVADGGAALWFPDYVGNYMFNTIGNLSRYPRCGLLFIDFETGDTLQVSGAAAVDWHSARASSVPGAQRIVDLTVERAVFAEGAIPIDWTLIEPAPDLKRYRHVHGSERPPAVVPEAAVSIAGFRRLVVTEIAEEAVGIRSLYLEAPDGAPLPVFLPGQYLPVMIEQRSDAPEGLRHYSLSNFEAAPHRYRIGVKRIGRMPEAPSSPGVSITLHDRTSVGSTLLAGPPAGAFTLDPAGSMPVALISAGIGVTPVLSMLIALSKQGSARPVCFIQGARNGAELAYAAEVRRLSDSEPNIKTHFRFSQPRPSPADFPGRDYDSIGHIDFDLVQSLASVEAEFFLCGPSPFMDRLRADLVAWGVPPARIRVEAFASVGEQVPDLGKPGAKVAFVEHAKQAIWRPGSRSILDLAESVGLQPVSSCRSGSCGTCEHRLLSGEVRYPVDPEYRCAEGRILLCRAQPISDVEIATS